MRIAYLLESTELSGGVKVVLLQAEALARRGHRVAIVSADARPDWFPLSRAHFERSAFRDSAELPRAEIRVATFWTTVAPALEDAAGPVFHLSQGYEGDFSFYAASRRAIEDAYHAPAVKLTVSKTLARLLEERGFGRAVDVGQAFEADGFSPGPERPPGDPPVVLLVGPYEADVKGLAVALAGLSLWRRRGGSFRVRRVSPLPAGDEEKSWRVVDEYHHRIRPERMPFAYRASDVFIGASRPEEGFGLPALEALACGLPCLLSDTPGHREFAGESAWYFPDGDPAAIADRLPELICDEARKRARIEGPAAAARFSTADVALRLENAFRDALAGRA
ncbi:MAG TPA: glycosyltransferase family 4 protein [Thermoanaerobaculia bacterium]|jgi:glycosyltransferase involved in cell wall biosynthesis|nr:glycosyltransferase family 4 protein [Thermoanaerobaculia bacterium]